jgi:tRNA1(Val) A37 N6-methylase TrmN6
MTIHKNPNSIPLEVVNYEETRLLDGRVVCLQTKNGYRAAIDPVFLAAAIDANAGDRVLDVGSGTGAASLCLAARVQGVEITGIEIQPEYAEMARKSANLTGVEKQINFITADLTALPKSENFREFNHVMTNPPYIVAGQGRVPPDRMKARATFESHVALDQWIFHCLKMTRSRGIFTIIHRADRLEHIMASITGILGDIVVFPLWPSRRSRNENEYINANRIIVSGRKGVKSPGILSSGIALHEGQDGGYTSEALSILTHASLLKLNK